MNFEQTQQTVQEQRQLQTISQQQLLQSQLAELPLDHLLERISDELNDNPALEQRSDDPYLSAETPQDAGADGQKAQRPLHGGGRICGFRTGHTAHGGGQHERHSALARLYVRLKIED